MPGTIRNGMLAVDEVRSQFYNFYLPYLTIMGSKEKMVDVFGPLDFAAENCSGDKTTIYCKDMWHNFLWEEEVVAIAEIVASWLKERL